MSACAKSHFERVSIVGSEVTQERSERPMSACAKSHDTAPEAMNE